MLGGLLGWQHTLWAIAVASFTGSFVGIALAVKTKQNLRTLTIPFGPFLAFGGIFVHLLNLHFLFADS